MGGSIDVQSRPGVGSVFTFTMKAFMNGEQIQNNEEENKNQSNQVGSLESYFDSNADYDQDGI